MPQIGHRVHRETDGRAAERLGHLGTVGEALGRRLGQRAVGPGDGVEVDAEIRRQPADRRERRARDQPPGGDMGADLPGDLPVDRLP